MAFQIEIKQLICPCRWIYSSQYGVAVCIYNKSSKICTHCNRYSIRTSSTHSGNFNYGQGVLKYLKPKTYLPQINIALLKKTAELITMKRSATNIVEKGRSPLLLNTDAAFESHSLRPRQVSEPIFEKSKDDLHSSTGLPFKKLNQPLYTFYLGKPFAREQHDFHQAMIDKFESISSFHTNYDSPSDNEGDRNKPCADDMEDCKDREQVASVDERLVDAAEASAVNTTPADSPSITSLIKGTFSAAGTALRSASDSLIPKNAASMREKLKKYQKKVVSSSGRVVHNTESKRIEVYSKKQLEKRTIGLAQSLTKAKTDSSRCIRLEELCIHLVFHPEFTSIALRVS